MTITWGILGTGRVAGIFTEDLLLAGHRVAAVGSRAPGTAAAFAARYGIGRAYGSYAELAADDRLDIVYVATPHSSHHPLARQCLEAGRAVLVEKPFTTSPADARDLVALARRRGLFLMEAMWTRFNPVIVKLRSLVSEGRIGEIKAVYADFSVAHDFDPAHRLWAPALGGGALLDLGVYALSFASMLLGRPDSAEAMIAPAPTGVDANTGILLGYSSGAVALLHCGLLAESPQTATVVGTTGWIEVGTPFFRPTRLVLHRHGAAAETYSADIRGHGYVHQAEEVARCLRAGLIESPMMPLDDSLSVLDTAHAVAQRSATARRSISERTPSASGTP
ncbi:Gfo/Idh/MocA family protein [Actinoallomurus soli]|uniref:Gfo/Idh/MocA family protein n=1 Tax=Actinoallomurus soli TaxID=2952535 RepID=UPI002093AD51|nr:Gfo/Idh/MocA family oxidoreductase [Actinoallomurus soli]MCO5972490.1 Gfo/Idh/MocA family oxidoreductase [Actinoallomurus soli]